MFLEVVAGYWGLLDDIKDYANSWRFCEDHKDNWGSTTEQLTCLIDQKIGKPGAPGGWPHMDFLQIGGAGCAGPIAHCPGQTDDEYKTEFVIWSLMQSPLIVDTDVRNMTAIMKKSLLNEELLAIHQSVETPPGQFMKRWTCAEPLKCEVWGRQLNEGGSDWMVALVNRGSDSHSMTITWGDLGWNKEDTATVRDLWEKQDVKSDAQESIEMVKVPSHSTAVLRLTKTSQAIV